MRQSASNMNELMQQSLVSGRDTVLAAASALPERDALAHEIGVVQSAASRGYFLPDEDELIKMRYGQYLSLRASLLETIDDMGSLAGGDHLQWNSRLPLFATAFSAACILMRANRFIIDLASQYSVLWKKLDEEDTTSGIPRKSFTTIYQALTSPRNQLRFLNAAEYYTRQRKEIVALSEDPEMSQIVRLLQEEEPYIERRRHELIKRRISYRWFSFLRKNRSAWKNVMRGLFEVSGRAIADLHQPGIKPPGAPKRIQPALRSQILELVQPGDVFVTRHDDALSNLFLPGFWPHAALFLGDETGIEIDWDQFTFTDEPTWFLESKKDGVKVRPASETLAVDALVVLRPPLAEDDLRRGIKRAMTHRGKPYDFLFDFRTADKLVCTEVIYRGFHGIGPVAFQLREVGGRLCLPAEEFLDQALAMGFTLVLTAGLEGDLLLSGPEAMQAFVKSRRPLKKGDNS